jgi:hypothetical protein
VLDREAASPDEFLGRAPTWGEAGAAGTMALLAGGEVGVFDAVVEDDVASFRFLTQ